MLVLNEKRLTNSGKNLKMPTENAKKKFYLLSSHAKAKTTPTSLSAYLVPGCVKIVFAARLFTAKTDVRK